MSQFLFSLNVIAPMVMYLIIGYGLHKAKIIDDHFIRVGNTFTFYVTLPILLFNSFTTVTLDHGLDLSFIGYILGSMVIYNAFGWWYIRRHRGIEPFQKGAAALSMVRGNVLVFGYPLVAGLYGGAGNLEMALTGAFTAPLSALLAAMILSYFAPLAKKKSLGPMILGFLLNPLVLSAVLGFTFKFLNITIPTMMTEVLNPIGAMATPFALIILGGSFRFTGFVHQLKRILGIITWKMIVSPIILLAIAIALGFRSYELACILAVVATPNAVSNYAMSAEMNSDAKIAGDSIIVSVLIAPFTLFLFVYIFLLLGWL